MRMSLLDITGMMLMVLKTMMMRMMSTMRTEVMDLVTAKLGVLAVRARPRLRMMKMSMLVVMILAFIKMSMSMWRMMRWGRRRVDGCFLKCRLQESQLRYGIGYVEVPCRGFVTFLY